jgi:hypothetical protein
MWRALAATTLELTGTVFLFSQCLRKLLGIWCREAASKQLRAFAIRRPPEKATKELLDRGDTWIDKGASAALQLMTQFVNPTRRFQSHDLWEPGCEVIQKQQARAAILFGPPGTSKTTLSSCVADVIGSDYIELHASHFVANGLSNVQKTADEIFEKLMQLDRTVILFDEIDELVRARSSESDPFGRFLTTSMLPKLAELWKGRKVIYFVATNYIGDFDSAITRAERFDAVISVAPPSFEKKMKQLKELLEMRGYTLDAPSVSERDVTQAFARVIANEDEKSSILTSDCLAKFLLMRWDQLDELASIIQRASISGRALRLTAESLGDALGKLSEPSLMIRKPFLEFADARKYEQHDYRKVSVWLVEGSVPVKIKPPLVNANGKVWYETFSGFDDLSKFPCESEVVYSGVVRCKQSPTEPKPQSPPEPAPESPPEPGPELPKHFVHKAAP